MKALLTPHHPTPGQLRVLRVLHAHSVTNGHAPTIREVCDTLGITSTNAVAEHLDLLEEKGLVEHQPGTARTLKVTRRGLAALGAQP